MPVCLSVTTAGVSTGGSDRRAAEQTPVLPLADALRSKSQEKQSMLKAAQRCYLCCSAPSVSRAHLCLKAP